MTPEPGRHFLGPSARICCCCSEREGGTRFFFQHLVWAALALVVGAGAAAAQPGGGLCADPPGFCQRFMKPACLDKLGAGAEAIGADAACSGQLDAYRICVSAAAETCAPGAKAATAATQKTGGVYTTAAISARPRTF